MKIKLISIVVTLAISKSLSAVELNSTYIDNYVREVTPALKGMYRKRYPDMPSRKVSIQAGLHANKMAKCQLHAIDHYPETYKQASITPIENGGDLQIVGKSVTTMMKADIQSGARAMPEFKKIVGSAAARFRACMK
mgnify:CR=1 FL=1